MAQNAISAFPLYICDSLDAFSLRSVQFTPAHVNAIRSILFLFARYNSLLPMLMLFAHHFCSPHGIVRASPTHAHSALIDHNVRIQYIYIYIPSSSPEFISCSPLIILGGGALNIYWCGVPRHIKRGVLGMGTTSKRGVLGTGTSRKRGSLKVES